MTALIGQFIAEEKNSVWRLCGDLYHISSNGQITGTPKQYALCGLKGDEKIYKIRNTRLIHCHNTQFHVFRSLHRLHGHAIRESALTGCNEEQVDLFYSSGQCGKLS